MRQTLTEEQKESILRKVAYYKQMEARLHRQVDLMAAAAATQMREAAAAGIPQKDIMEAAGIKRTRLHEIIHGKQ